jgi:hypothetical protein
MLMLGNQRPSVQTGRLTTRLTKKEKAALEASWSLEQKNRGFHTFGKSLAKDYLQAVLKERGERLRAEAEERGEDYVPEETFSALHRVKSELWAALSKEERNDWREKGKSVKVKEIWMDQ